MKKIFGKIGFLWFAIVFAGQFLLYYPLFLIFLSHESMYPLANALRKFWAWTTLLLTASWPIIKYSKDQFSTPCVFVANHTSYLDIVVLGLFAPLKVCFIGKYELAKIPLFGIFFRTVDIAVKRESIKDAHRAFEEAKARLARGYSVLIFPEGTIWNRTPEIKPFKNGAFKMAIEAKVPIVPISFLNNFKRLPDEKFEFYPGLIRCSIHRPILTNHLNDADADQLKDEIYQTIKQDLIQNHILHEDHR
ncbi:MAG: hypothetical protein RLZZ60_772 [Bacteroidota bacterium]